MKKRILLINGHPDPKSERLCAALGAAYLKGAHHGGHQVQRIDIGELDLTPAHAASELAGAVPPQIKALQDQIAWADHLVLVYPLWLGGPPAVLKAFLEQVFRHGFGFAGAGMETRGLLKGRTARVVVTMGMRSSIFHLLFAGAGLKSVTRGVLMVCGYGPVRSTVVGDVNGPNLGRLRHLARCERLGEAAA